MKNQEPIYDDNDNCLGKVVNGMAVVTHHTTGIGLSDHASQIVSKVKALRAYTERTGFKTTRSQNELIQSLENPNDLAGALLLLND
jgi:hypothetical protein